ncbi:hypothetical protein BH09VER1_BH09VER1_51330 [soil metagenome]
MHSFFLNLLRVALVLFALLVLLAIAVVGVTVYRGHEEWATTKRELATKGEKIGADALVMPAVPDEQNFYADPLWAEIAETATVDGAGRVVYVPAVPLAEQRLNVLGKALPAPEVKRLREAYPLLMEVNFGQEPRSVLLKAWRRAGEHDEAWRNELAKATLELLAAAAPVLERVDELQKRPGTRFPANYEEGTLARMPQLGAVQKVAQAFILRARAEIQIGQAEAALADITRVDELGKRLQVEPYVLAQLVMFAGYNLELETVDAGLRQHAWTDAQLAALQARWREVDLLPLMVRAVRGERAGFNLFVDRLERGEDVGGVLTEKDGRKSEGKTTVAQIYLYVCGGDDRSLRNREEQMIIDAVAKDGWRGVRGIPYNEVLENPSILFRYTHMLTLLTFVPWEPYFLKAAFYQDSFAQADMACGLERYYLAHREYPEKLEALVPEYLPAIPCDVLTGTPMHYERTAADQFKLWAEGWNGKDDGGTVAAKMRLKEGDWVWGKCFF